MQRPTLEQIAMLPRLHQATIPEDYLDAMGHMNVMWFTHLFSLGMVDLWGQIGIDKNYVDQNRAGTFALEKHVRYLTELRVGEEASIYGRLVSRTEKLFHVVQFMVNETQQRLASTMETVGAHVDLEARQTAPFPEGVAAAYDKLLAEHAALDWPPPLCGAMQIK